MRDAPRLYVEAMLEAGTCVTLDEDRRHYLLHVMRASAGDKLRLFNADSGEWDARIARATRDGLSVEVEQCRRPPRPGSAGPTLLFAPLKRDATDLVVRMATELGVSRVRPVSTARTIAGRVNLDRMSLIAREAAEQCERLDLPTIEPPLALAALLDEWPAEQPIAAAVERSNTRRLGDRRAGPPAGALLVGPEGGFAPAELDALLRRPFVEPVSLGALVLRSETASAVGLALLRLERLGCDVEPG